MSIVVRYSNWSYLDQLDGIDIVDGERLRITWPDGHKSFETARVIRGINGYDCPTSYATISQKIHGQEVNLSLVGLEAEREVGE